MLCTDTQTPLTEVDVIDKKKKKEEEGYVHRNLNRIKCFGIHFTTCPEKMHS